jgi:hypothetical protein
MHVDYSNALLGAAMRTRVHSGLEGPATRSSIERVAWMRLALAQLDQALLRARTSQDRALIHATSAHHLVIWGCPWEALVEFRKAQSLDPAGWSAIADLLAMRLSHPDRPDPEVLTSSPAEPSPRP